MFSWTVDECKPLVGGDLKRMRQLIDNGVDPNGRGAHSSTFRLNLFASCGTWVVRLGVV
jgi:hypothetical protein